MKVHYMLDTNMVSYIVKGHSQAARNRMLNLERDEAVCLSVITEAEVLYGFGGREPCCGKADFLHQLGE